MIALPLKQPAPVATQNACKLCAPLGASVVFRGIRGAMSLLHGSQGCSTYIRRYLISHFKEPVDIASSNFSEASAVFGGGKDLHKALANLTRGYKPELIGIASTCLSETMGDDVGMYLKQYTPESGGEGGEGSAPQLVHVSTPSYAGSHMDGFYATVRAVADTLANPPASGQVVGPHVNLFPGFVSPADLRYLHEIFRAWDLPLVMLPDYSETLDGTQWETYQSIPSGGTPVDALRTMGHARTTLEFSLTLDPKRSAAESLLGRCGVVPYHLGLPIGIRQTDALCRVLESLTGRPLPALLVGERGRLLDAYVDAHKYCFGRRAVIYGEEDLAVGLAALVAELGIVPVLVASGGRSGRLAAALRAAVPNLSPETVVKEDVDFVQIGELAAGLRPDLLIGSSKGYPLARQFKIPLIRAGFPVHDRLGGQRLLHLGYRGATVLLDRITDALLSVRQETSDVGYAYL